MGKTIIRIGGDRASLDAWEARQAKLAWAKSTGEIPYCMCMNYGVPLELFTREGKIYFRKIKNTQHSDTCEYGTHKKVAHMPVKPQKQEPPSGMLHALWEEAELNKWHSGLEGKRFWGVVKSRVLAAAAKHKEIAGKVFAPESFNPEKTDEQKTVALQQLDNIISKHGHVLLFGEVKELKKSKFDTEVIIRHAKFLRLWAKEGLITPAEEGCLRFVLAKIKKSEKGNFYVDSAEQLLTSRTTFLPCHDAMEAQLLDAVAKRHIAMEVESVNGVTSIATKNPPLRVWIAAENRTETVSDINKASKPGEVLMLLDAADPDKTINLLFAMSGKSRESAQINDEERGFSD